MELNNIKGNTSWEEASGEVNANNRKIVSEFGRVGVNMDNVRSEMEGLRKDTTVGLLSLPFDIPTTSQLTKPTIKNPNTNETIILKIGHATRVLDKINEVGQPYYYQYDGSDWNETKFTALPSDLPTKDDIHILENPTFSKDIIGTEILSPKLLRKLILGIEITSVGYDDSLYYSPAKFLLNGDKTQITIQIFSNSSVWGNGTWTLVKSFTVPIDGEKNYVSVGGDYIYVDTSVIAWDNSIEGVNYNAAGLSSIIFEKNNSNVLNVARTQSETKLNTNSIDALTDTRTKEFYPFVLSMTGRGEEFSINQFRKLILGVEITSVKHNASLYYSPALIQRSGNIGYITIYSSTHPYSPTTKLMVFSFPLNSESNLVLSELATGDKMLIDKRFFPTSNLQSISYNNAGFDPIVFDKGNDSLINTLEAKNANVIRVDCEGDSLTYGTNSHGGHGPYPLVLQSLLGAGCKVNNYGVHGETIASIFGRSGAIPMYLSNDVELPSDTSEVIIGTGANQNIQSIYKNRDCNILIGNTRQDNINPCIIGGIECNLRFTGTPNTSVGDIVLSRVKNGDAKTLRAGTVIYASQQRVSKKSAITVSFVGTNGMWVDAQDLLDQYKRYMTYNSNKEVLIIGGFSVRSPQDWQSAEELLSQEYGSRFVNLREYLITYALSDAVRLGYLANDFEPTQADLDAIAIGKCPPTLMSETIHFNWIGYALLGHLVYNRMIEIGIV